MVMLMKRFGLLLIMMLVFGLGLQPSEALAQETTKIYVNLWNNQLNLIKNGERVAHFPIAPGSNRTPTPIGHFKVVQKSKDWGGGFGSRWLGLNVPWGKFGIHGTNRPYLVGRSVSSGCIRMRNRDVEELYPKVPVGTPVDIDGPIFGRGKYAYRNLSVGSKGTIVMLIQNHLRAAGLYDGPVDGIYGFSTKEAVKRYQRLHNLPITGNVGKAVYREMGFIE
ncbi:MAG TPA: L,D-transpeptidase family protein [Bacillales bacterium]|nr:L,D-transpeptidase family protein [Bacillales bacterium]